MPPPIATPPMPAAPEQPRLLGRSRAYTADNLPARLRQWHAPRINRWERLWVTQGALTIECLCATGSEVIGLAAHANRWFAPGTRWRVLALPADARFELEVHADVKGQAEAPQPLRSTLLDAAPRVGLTDAAAFGALLDALPAGERRVVDLSFDPTTALAPRLATHTLFWHPLAATAQGCTALVTRSEAPFNLAAYLGRDHAVIEATLGGALAGDTAATAWLHATLARHLFIEEALLFPAYLEAGGRAAWVKGLLQEHTYLRRYLVEFDDARSRRYFLRLLDGHDEKEERVIYPDVLAHVGARADALLDAALATPASAAGARVPNAQSSGDAPGR